MNVKPLTESQKKYVERNHKKMSIKAMFEASGISRHRITMHLVKIGKMEIQPKNYASKTKGESAFFNVNEMDWI